MSFEFAGRIRQQIKDGELKLVASSLAFSTVLSLIPFLAVSLALIQRLGGMDDTFLKVEKWILSNFSDTVGKEGVRLMHLSLSRMLSGKLGTLGAIILIFTSTRLIADMEVGINRVWNIENERSMIQRLSFYWLLILFLPFGFAGIVSAGSFIDSIGKDVIDFSFLFIGLTLVYKLVPACRVAWSSAFGGALAGAILTALVQRVFLFAVHSVFNYGKLYGSIAALPIFLLWILIIWYGVLIGAIISASLQEEYGGGLR